MSNRQYVRHYVDIRVDCASREMFVANYVTNISTGGLFMRTDQPLPVDSEIFLKLFLPDTTIEARGRVVWTYDLPKGSCRIVAGNGIKFIDLPEEHRLKLERFLDELIASPAPGPSPVRDGDSRAPSDSKRPHSSNS